MGKTSLVDRILSFARKQKCRTVRLNLLQAEDAKLSNLNHFLRWFCACVSQKLRLPSELDNYWDTERGSIVNCTTYFQEHLLEQLDSPLVLALDEVDRVFQFPTVAQGFFPMLRSWYEEARIDDLWEKLRLVVVHSTEDYGALDLNQSPFNIGLPVDLTEFTPEQVSDLAQRHQLPWSHPELQLLMTMVGGHPYLVRLALYHIASQDMTLEQLLQDAPTNAGIYAEHLRRHLNTLKENPHLGAALVQVVYQSESVRLDTLHAYQLHSMGLIKQQGDCVRSRCQLYQDYFSLNLQLDI